MAESVGPATSADGPVAPQPNPINPGLGQANPNPVPPVPDSVGQPLPPQPKPVGKVYTDYTQLQADHFPEKFKSTEKKKWVSQKSDLVVLINKQYLDIAAAIPFKDKLGNVSQLNQIFFGGYKIKFDGFNYISQNKLEELSLEKQPKVICIGSA